jgi:calcium-dependent protein kinase
VYIVLSGTPPFNGNSDSEIMKKVKAGKYSFDIPEFKNISEKARDFISKLLTVDPEKRVSAEQALQHSWILEMGEAKVDVNLAQGALANLKTFRAD